MRLKLCWGVFAVLVGLFVLTVTPLGRMVHIKADFSNMVIPLGLLGALLLVLVTLTAMSKLLKIFLLITAISAIGWAASLYSHSLLFDFFPTEPVTYVLFFFIFTPAFIIGAAGSLIIGIRHHLPSR